MMNCWYYCGSGTICPNAVIAPYCLIYDTDLITESVLLPGTATSPNTELSRLVVRVGRFVNARSGVCVAVPDDFILGDVLKAEREKPPVGNRSEIAFIATLAALLLWFFVLRR